MLYKVQAKIIKDKMKDYFEALTHGNIEMQKPDGSFIIKAMKDACMIDDETITWYEACYCCTPFQHERETVYDDYLYDFKTKLVYEVKDDIQGDSFWSYLEEVYYEEAYSY